MTIRVTSWLARPGLLRALVSETRLALRLFREPRVPALTKALPLLPALYLFAPLDAVPDLLPVLGQIDDIGVALVTLKFFLRLCPSGAKTFHEEAIAQGRAYTPMAAADDFIDTEWRHE
jgi:uncharacterized membrane protein YkvA (DUF1232 family)